jgi:hypothetical protein
LEFVNGRVIDESALIGGEIERDIFLRGHRVRGDGSIAFFLFIELDVTFFIFIISR